MQGAKSVKSLGAGGEFRQRMRMTKADTVGFWKVSSSAVGEKDGSAACLSQVVRDGKIRIVCAGRIILNYGIPPCLVSSLRAPDLCD